MARGFLLGLLLLLLLPATAAANGMPMAAARSGAGGNLLPAARSSIAVRHEQLQIDMRGPNARIRATYALQAGSAEAATIAFPMLSLGTPEPNGVWLDGVPLPARPAGQPVALAPGEGAVAPEWLDPFSGAPYQPREYGRNPEQVGWALFDVPFAPGQARELAVEYTMYYGQDFSRFVAPASRVDYLLLPARHWASFGELEVEVLVPAGRALASTVPLQAPGSGRYTGRFSALPDRNLSLFLAPGGGLPGVAGSWWWRRAGRPWALLLLAAVAGLLAGEAYQHGRGAVLFLVGAGLLLLLTP